MFFGTCEKRDTFCLGGDGKYSKIEFSHARIFVLLNHRLFITCTLLLYQQFCTSLKGPVHLHPFLIFIHFCFSLVHTLSLSHTYTQSHHVLLSSFFFFIMFSVSQSSCMQNRAAHTASVLCLCCGLAVFSLYSVL